MAGSGKDGLADALIKGASAGGAAGTPTLAETFLDGASAGGARSFGLAPAPGEDNSNFPDDGSTRH